MKTASIMALSAAVIAFSSCGDDTGTFNAMDANVPVVDPPDGGALDTGAPLPPTANFEFDVVTFAVAGGVPQEVPVNGLPLVDLPGANKLTADTWEVVTRSGVRFSHILARAGVTAADDVPVNCVARDGFDPLRTKLANDTTKLPTFAFLRDYGYVYVGNPGDKDPLYPTMEGKSLIVDYAVASDAEVPPSLGGKLASLGMFRWKMIEKVDAVTRGIVEIGPVVP